MIRSKNTVFGKLQDSLVVRSMHNVPLVRLENAAENGVTSGSHQR